MADLASKVFECDDLRHLQSSGLKHCHYAVVFGAVCGSLALPLDAALAAYMSGVARTAVASAVRLDRVGPVGVSESELIMSMILGQVSQLPYSYSSPFAYVAEIL